LALVAEAAAMNLTDIAASPSYYSALLEVGGAEVLQQRGCDAWRGFVGDAMLYQTKFLPQSLILAAEYGPFPSQVILTSYLS
jgi:hypothetical protein